MNQFYLTYLLLLLTSVLAGQNAQFVGQCGVEAISDSTYEAYEHSMGSTSPCRAAMGDRNGSYEIPVHAYILRNSATGLLSRGRTQEEIEGLLVESLRYSSEALAPRISFNIVEVDVVSVNAGIFTSVYFSQIRRAVAFALGGSTGTVDDNTMNIYLNEIPSARGSFPSGIIIDGGRNSGRWLLHEIGHYFGLLHTHQYTVNSGRSASVVYMDPEGNRYTSYPDHERLHSSFNEVYCDGSADALCYGDFIESTPPDYVDQFSSDLNQYAFNVDVDALVEYSDPDGNVISDSFHPPYFNIMSYWNTTSVTLNQDQKDRMYDVLTISDCGSSNFGGDMTFLTEPNNVPTDNFTEDDFYYLRQSSRIELVSSDNHGNEEFSPFRQGKITVRSNTNNEADVHTEPYFGEGVLKNNRFIRTNIDGDFIRWDFSQLSENCEALPEYDPLNYLTVSDITAITEHILGRQPFQSPYQLIAADVDMSSDINVLDMVAIQRVILGLDANFDVPDYQFLPTYALSDNFQFRDDFYADPFAAIWNYDGNSFSYLPDSDGESYLGASASTVSGNIFPRTISFPLTSTDPLINDVNTTSFYVIRSGDVVDSNNSGNLCHQMTFMDSGEETNLDPGLDNEIVIKINGSKEIRGVDLIFNIVQNSDAYIESINDRSVDIETMYAVRSSSSKSFNGGVVANSKQFRLLSVLSNLENEVDSIKFTIGGVTKKTSLSEIVSLDCSASRISYANSSKEKSVKTNHPPLVSFTTFRGDSNEPQQSEKFEVLLFPNPVKARLYWRLSGTMSEEIEVEISDQTGRIIQYHKLMSHPEIEGGTSLSDLSEGVYFVRFYNGENVVTKKISVIR